VIAGLLELLADARRRRSAVLAFTCYDAESAAGVLTAADGRPVVMLTSPQLLNAPGGDLIVAALRAMAERARSPVCLQLDHAHDLDTIRIGCELGMTAVMADGSRLHVEANVEFVREARRIAARRGVAVEAQLGRLAGHEEVAHEAASEELTEVEGAVRFVTEAEPDCLGLCVGNVHGYYMDEPRLELARIRAIAARLGLPLVLHGGSGLPAAAIASAVAAGITKVNVNTELRRAYLARTQRELPVALDGARLLALHTKQMKAVQAAAAEKFAIVEAPTWPRPAELSETARGLA
jgi:tagatose 1,6-diphosphate aldolase GatY/KbaY